jgi:beta-galactosidase
MHHRAAGVFRGLGILLTGSAMLLLASCTTTKKEAPSLTHATPPRQQTLLDANWRFHLGDISPSDQVTQEKFDDSQWQQIDVPHDYVLGGQYSKSDNHAERGHGYLPYDVGWYRKTIVIPESMRGKILSLDFDGVFRASDLWLNGQHLGKHLSGYTPFSYDITKLAKIGSENTIVVRVDPRDFEGWWYEGGGIYRHVYLTAVAPVHVARYGTQVVSTVPNGDQGSDASADVSIRTTLEHSGAGEGSCVVVTEIFGPDGKSVSKHVHAVSASAAEAGDVLDQYTIDHPRLWSPDSPSLYQLRTTVMQDGKPVDATTTNFGIRTLRYDKDHGFFLNGKHVEIQGLANHQDLGGVGIAVPDSLQPWRVATLKAMGCNAWRTAHNPPSEALLDACDRLGLMVMDENRHLGDAYTHHAQKGLTGDNLADLATMIQRDRNHPSIIMWSMSNEEGQQHTPQGAAVFGTMKAVVRKYDQTRPVTSAINANINHRRPDADQEDILGINYHDKDYDTIRKTYPDKCLFGSEDTNQKTTRGEYADNKETGMCSAYNLSETGWQAVINRPYFAGSFTWTGFDYRGEPNPFGWPDVSNNTGLVDLCGFPKDKYYYFESCWSDKPMVHILPSTWNWKGKEGQPIRVLTWSNAKQVELFLNGKSLGKKDIPRAAHAEWQVPYEPGELLAKASTDGKIIATDKQETTNAALKIELSPDRKTLHADNEDAIVVPVSLLDDKGRVVPDSSNRVSFEIKGDGKILGVSNGNPADHDSDKATQRNAFHGHCIAVIMAGTKPGKLTITATSPGLKPASATFVVR